MMQGTIVLGGSPWTPSLSEGLRLHHIGFVVSSIGESAPGFVSNLGMEWSGEIFDDPVQDVRVTFLRHRLAGLPLIELVEPSSAKSHILGFVKRGGGLHHLCYEVDELDRHLESIVGSGAILVRQPAPAVAFGGQHIAWICTSERLLVEFLERKPSVRPQAEGFVPDVPALDQAGVR